ncbi:Ltp family lipoprotein [Arthrobacter sp. M-10]|uniref:Ltp family lipoprotein n=1 Tax=unclassified Arthrobacter TaxID=235627 RepID=UPI003F9091DF
MTENYAQIDKKNVKSNAKAQAAADKAYRKASRPWFKKKRFLFPLILVVIIVIAIAANSGKKDTAATSAAATSTASTQAAGPAAPSGTAAQLQALAAAKGYLDSGIGFSQASLTKQLTSSAGNGFAQADAQWAVDHSGADWNGQALKAAKGYLTSGMGFSQASLTKQLTSSAGNEFTAPQAESAVANSGADWNAEAVKAAKGYMSSGMGFSRQSLITQLTSAAGNQFTDAQAGYAADQVGLK